MKYEERLVKELKNPDGHLWWDDSWPLSDLDGMARDMLHYNNQVEAKIASLFIFHQLTEEIIGLLYRYCNLVLRASLFPIKITESKPDKYDDFSKNIKALEASVEFNSKSNLIKASRELNDLRNDIGHRLLEKYRAADFDENLKKSETLFDKIFQYKNEALKWFYIEIDRIKMKKELAKIIDKY